MDKVDYSKSIQSVLVICIALLVLAIAKKTSIPIYLCLPLGLGGLLSSKLADKIHWAWMQLAWIMSLIFPPILLGGIYFLFLTPLAKLSQLFSKKDSLTLKKSQNSTFILRKRPFEKTDFTKTW